MKNFFITGTDTDIGKTLVAAILTLAARGCYWKPIQSGTSHSLSDQEQIKQWTGLPDNHFFNSCYSFKAPLSPDQAAHLENTQIDLSTCQTPNTSQTLIVEGAGGVLVPLNPRNQMVDLIKKVGLPVILVARGTLGTINHTLLSIEALRYRQIPIHGVVFNGELNLENQIAIESWGKVKTLCHIPVFNQITPAILSDWVQNNKTLLEAQLC
jgi:dethiobiotin synthetase